MIDETQIIMNHGKEFFCFVSADFNKGLEICRYVWSHFFFPLFLAHGTDWFYFRFNKGLTPSVTLSSKNTYSPICQRTAKDVYGISYHTRYGSNTCHE